MGNDAKPRMRDRLGRGARETGEGLSYLLAGAMPWVMHTYVDATVPDAVTNLATALVVGVAVRARDHLERRG